MDAVASVWSRRGERVPRSWNVWPAAGGGPTQVSVRGVERVDAHCELQLTLRTNRSKGTGSGEGEGGSRIVVEGRFGVAVDDLSRPVGRVDGIARTDAGWSAAQRALTAARPGFRLEALYRHARTMYLVAEKPRPPSDVGDCPAVTLMTGWLVAGGTGRQVIAADRTVDTDCDYKEARIGFPLGILQVAERSFWVLQDHGYEDERYQLIEVGDGGVHTVLEVEGGGC
jgi:hypothetical protein